MFVCFIKHPDAIVYSEWELTRPVCNLGNREVNNQIYPRLVTLGGCVVPTVD